LTDKKRSAAAKKAAATRRKREEEQAKADANENPVNDAERDENGETQAERDAARDARTEQVLGPQESEVDSNVHEPYHKPLENAGFDHLGAEQERQAELAAQREEHNRRTGDASLR
jgi:hypothetical protein